MRLEKLNYPQGNFYTLTLFNFQIDTYDWSLGIKRQRNQLTIIDLIFSLRCAECRRFSLGCRDHWFCGMCRDCER